MCFSMVLVILCLTVVSFVCVLCTLVFIILWLGGLCEFYISRFCQNKTGVVNCFVLLTLKLLLLVSLTILNNVMCHTHVLYRLVQKQSPRQRISINRIKTCQ